MGVQQLHVLYMTRVIYISISILREMKKLTFSQAVSITMEI